MHPENEKRTAPIPKVLVHFSSLDTSLQLLAFSDIIPYIVDSMIIKTLFIRLSNNALKILKACSESSSTLRYWVYCEICRP